MSLLSGLGGIIGGIGGFLTGGVPGAIGGYQAGQALLGGGGGGGNLPATVPPATGPANPGSGGGAIPYGTFPNIGPFIPVPSWAGGPQTAQPSAAGCPKGYHLNKHALAATKRHGALPARSICVRNRRMQALNSRAITRSLRRIKRANKIVRKLHAFAPSRRIAAGGRSGHRPGCGCVVCRRR